MLGFSEIADSILGDNFLAEIGEILPETTNSAGFYARLRDNTVPRLLSRFATGAVNFIKISRTASGDNLKPYNLSETSYSRNSIVTGWPSKLVDGSRILSGDLRVIFGANNFAVEPTNDDQVEIDSVRYAIIDVKAVMAAGTIKCLYILQVRQSGSQ